VNAVELIERKRDGGRLAPGEVAWLIDAYSTGTVPDYQMAAMAMAVFLRGLDHEELAAWTVAMLESGDVLDLSDLPGVKVDKHSTGGVGDKASIPLAPMVASTGVVVPMISGRGLGHTGGTLDKLEAIPGFSTSLDPDRFRRILETCGMVMAGQSETLVPADRKLYALRDATGTVPSIPLIASSIMSKKLAEDLDALVLDVKVGRGAFMQDLNDGRRLADTIIDIGRARGVTVTALLTQMDQPLGREVGNASEIAESLAVLRGEGPADLTELVMALGVEMLQMAAIEEPRSRLERAVASGEALERLTEVIAAQGGDPRVVENPSLLPSARHEMEIPAPVSGVVTGCDARNIGLGAMRLGAGRERKEDSIDPAVGVTVHAKVGDRVDSGQPLCVVHYNEPGRLDEARPWLEAAWVIGEGAEPSPLVLERR
jgi:pyrimidine-nucleoside phosphorylase